MNILDNKICLLTLVKQIQINVVEGNLENYKSFGKCSFLAYVYLVVHVHSLKCDFLLFSNS